MEEAFTKIVQHIFNNWTALKLAVEHSMGGPNSKQTALDFMNYVVQFCMYESNVDEESIQDAIEDILDEEFETVCEDGSTKEIAGILFRFISLLKEDNLALCEEEFKKLPTAKEGWLIQSKLQPVCNVQANDSSSDDENEQVDAGSNSQIPMDEDSEWTQVKSRRKR